GDRAGSGKAARASLHEDVVLLDRAVARDLVALDERLVALRRVERGGREDQALARRRVGGAGQFLPDAQDDIVQPGAERRGADQLPDAEMPLLGPGLEVDL